MRSSVPRSRRAAKGRPRPADATRPGRLSRRGGAAAFVSPSRSAPLAPRGPDRRARRPEPGANAARMQRTPGRTAPKSTVARTAASRRHNRPRKGRCAPSRLPRDFAAVARGTRGKGRGGGRRGSCAPGRREAPSRPRDGAHGDERRTSREAGDKSTNALDKSTENQKRERPAPRSCTASAKSRETRALPAR